MEIILIIFIIIFILFGNYLVDKFYPQGNDGRTKYYFWGIRAEILFFIGFLIGILYLIIEAINYFF